MRRIPALALLVLAPALAGCASLEHRHDDTLPETVGKTLVLLPVDVGVILYAGFAADVRHRDQRLDAYPGLSADERDVLRYLR